MENLNSLPTLEKLIQSQIGVRVFLLLLVFYLFIFGAFLNEVYHSILSLELEIQQKSTELGNYIISEELVGNNQAIKLKLASLSTNEVKYAYLKQLSDKKNNRLYWHPIFDWSYIYQIEDIRKQKMGYLVVYGNFLKYHHFGYHLIIRLIFITIFSLIIFLFLYPLSKKIPKRIFMEPIKGLLKELNEDKNCAHTGISKYYSKEMFEVHVMISKLMDDVEKKAKDFAMWSLARQVAHDIRSPLVTLDAAISSIKETPEEKRIVIRQTLSRIHDIANNILQKNSPELLSKSTISESKKHTVILLSAIVDSLISEKRLQYNERMNIQIIFELDMNSYGIFSKINLMEFKRVLSNLINNAVESIDNIGEVRVSLYSENNYAIIKITDNGRGIPISIRNKLGQQDVTAEKENGTGLGLYHAYQTLKALRGGLEIISKTKEEGNNGTTIKLSLLQESPPAWFMNELYLPLEGELVIIDDDLSIHHLWAERLNFLSMDKKIQIRNFFSPDQLKNFLQNQYLCINKKFLFLFDYELLGYTETGLDLIQTLNLEKCSVLVTSLYEEETIRAKCVELGILLIPKSLAGLIPVRIS